MAKRQRAKRRDDDPIIPSRYGRSRKGTSYFSIVHTKHRDDDGRRLYKIRHWVSISGQIFHLNGGSNFHRAADIIARGTVFLKRRPSDKVLAARCVI